MRGAGAVLPYKTRCNLNHIRIPLVSAKVTHGNILYGGAEWILTHPGWVDNDRIQSSGHAFCMIHHSRAA